MRVDGDARMTLAEHLDELRVRLLRSILVLLAATVAAFAFYNSLVRVIMYPHFRAMEWCGIDDARFISASYGAPILAVMKLVFIVAFFAASPVIVQQIWGFVAAGLKQQERRWVVRFAPVSFLLFILGCVFGYFILIPYSLYGMARFMPLDQVRPLFAFSDYLSLVTTLTLVLGLVFQLPLVMVFVTSLGLVRSPSWGLWRRHALVANLVFAAVISPPDPLSMLVFAAPMIVLYEVGALASRLA